MVRRAAVIVALVTALVLPGCAQGPGPLRRRSGVESTLGTDPETVPPGTTYGPSGMGVDLVQAIGAAGPMAPWGLISGNVTGPPIAPSRS